MVREIPDIDTATRAGLTNCPTISACPRAHPPRQADSWRQTVRFLELTPSRSTYDTSCHGSQTFLQYSLNIVLKKFQKQKAEEGLSHSKPWRVDALETSALRDTRVDGPAATSQGLWILHLRERSLASVLTVLFYLLSIVRERLTLQ